MKRTVFFVLLLAIVLSVTVLLGSRCDYPFVVSNDNDGEGEGETKLNPHSHDDNDNMFANSPGNSANLGWVLERMPNDIYIGTEYGLSKVKSDGGIYEYVPFYTYGLNGCDNYLIFCRKDGLYTFDVSHTPEEMFCMSLLYDGAIDKTLLTDGYIYFGSRLSLYRIDVHDPIGLDLGEERFTPKPFITGKDPNSDEWDFSFTFSGKWTVGHEMLFVEYSREGYRRENNWIRRNPNGQSNTDAVFLIDTDLQGQFILDGWLYFIPYMPYASEAPWEDLEPGVYRMKADAEPVWMYEHETEFPAECLVKGNIQSFTVTGDILVCAGNIGESLGLYTVNLTDGHIIKIYDGKVLAPNTTSEYIWFRTDAAAEDNSAKVTQYNYWRIKFDGTKLQRLDYEKKRWTD